MISINNTTDFILDQQTHKRAALEKQLLHLFEMHCRGQMVDKNLAISSTIKYTVSTSLRFPRWLNLNKIILYGIRFYITLTENSHLNRYHLFLEGNYKKKQM